MTTTKISRCSEERRFISPEGKDGGGHMMCLTPLLPDGSCWRADEHHHAFINSGLGHDEWAASVVAKQHACS